MTALLYEKRWEPHLLLEELLRDRKMRVILNEQRSRSELDSIDAQITRLRIWMMENGVEEKSVTLAGLVRRDGEERTDDHLV